MPLTGYKEFKCLSLSYVSIIVSVAARKHRDKEQYWEERVFSSHFHITAPPPKEVSAGTWRQELMQRPWRGIALWFALHGLLSLLS